MSDAQCDTWGDFLSIFISTIFRHLLHSNYIVSRDGIVIMYLLR